jgi:hypothetical protein
MKIDTTVILVLPCVESHEGLLVKELDTPGAYLSSKLPRRPS